MSSRAEQSRDDDLSADADVESNSGYDNDVAPSEGSPLLSNDLPRDLVPSKGFQRRVLLMCLVSLFIVEVSEFITDPPQQKIIEDIICRGYYPDHVLQIKDQRCKDNHVQKTLAMVRGWHLAFGMAVPILPQFPFGIIADKYGRRPVLFLSLLGDLLQTAWVMMVLYFPDVFSIWAIIPGSLFFLIGGGGPMAGAMVWTIVADVVPTAERTGVFFRLFAASLLFNVMVNPISAWLLNYDPWLSMWIGLGFLIAGTLSVLLIPETLRFRQKADNRRRHGPGHEDDAEPEEHRHGVSLSKHSVLKQAWFTVKNDMQHVRRFIFASKTVIMLILTVATYLPIRVAYNGILLQYMTKRFNWEWSTATYISTVGVLSTVICLLVVLPVASHLLNGTSRFRSRPVNRDLVLARISLVFVSFGGLLMAFSGGPWLFIISLIITSFGHGFNALCRAVLNAVVEPHTIATLNTTITLIEMIMGLVAAPATSWLFSRGMDLGGAWMGLPFLAITGLSAGVCVMMFTVRVPHGVAQAHSD
ncbi:hypothetical protein NCS56_00774100 [Fusarium sp. Ph1]|nr:hypothetical protein NCS56_00774100 [Fusarium sp. Ph1]